MLRIMILIALAAGGAPAALALDRVVLKQAEGKLELLGRIEVKAQDGSLVLLARDGQMWLLEDPESILEQTQDERQFVPFGAKELAELKLKELPGGFKVHHTEHYVVCYNTPLAYAQWVGALYERLFTAFFAYWNHHKWPLREPEFPLIVVVFDSQDGYAAYARRELGEGVKSIIGYYHLKTNQVTMFDLTGAAGTNQTPARINTLLSAPGAERNVATIVHEATHQLAYNSGLQVRFADVPFWVSEGLAIFFETPDLSSAKGWKAIGKVNQHNLTNFQRSLARRQPDALESLLLDDKRFRDPRQAAEAYGEAWALNYFLLKRHGDDYVRYLQRLAKQQPGVASDPDERIKLFQQHFGDLKTLEVEFLRQMKNVR